MEIYQKIINNKCWILLFITYGFVITEFLVLFGVLSYNEVLDYLIDIMMILIVTTLYNPNSVFRGFLYSIENYKVPLLLNLVFTYLNSTLFKTIVSFIVFNGFVCEIKDL